VGTAQAGSVNVVRSVIGILRASRSAYGRYEGRQHLVSQRAHAPMTGSVGW
jgi:hypothetical protein